MHQVKDMPNPVRSGQFWFYLQNVTLMAKAEDMFAKNYNILRATEKGKRIN